MRNTQFNGLFVWFGISIAIGMGFKIIWSVAFWNNDNLYYWGNLAPLLAMIMMAYGGIRSYSK